MTTPLPPPQTAPAQEAPANVTARGEAVPWAWILAALLAGVGLGAVMWRGRRCAARDAAPEDIELPESDVQAGPEPVAPPAPAPAPAPDPHTREPLALELEPVRFSVSLVNATLQYRLRLTNLTGEAIGPLAIALDMIGAHASLSEDSQLARDGSGLELRHELAALGPDENSEISGELRLPLSAVTPIRTGTATLIVPLVRLRVEGPGIALNRAVVVGESPAAPGGLLRPFRLDTGPKIFGTLSQRGIAEAA